MKLARLEGPQNDARGLEEVLADPAIGGFEVAVLEDEPKDVLEQELEAFFDNRGRDDVLLLYFSGHGITTAAPGRAYYFATRTTLTERLKSTGIAAAYVNDLMKASRARQKVLLVDCCHGGAFKLAMVKSGNNAAVLESFQDDTTPGTGTAVITASQATQYALQDERIEGAPVQSVFTRVLIEGLKTGTADMNADGHVSVDELFDYLRENATTETQVPELSIVGSTGEIVIARNPHPTVLPAELPKDTQNAIRSDIWWQRQGVVAALAEYVQSADSGLALAARRELEGLVKDPDTRVSTAARGMLRDVDERIGPRPPADDQQPVDTTAPGVLSITRPARMNGALATMHLEINGRRVASLKNGGSTQVEVEAGTCLARITATWAGTPAGESYPVAIEIPPGARVAYEARYMSKTKNRIELSRLPSAELT